MPIKGIVRFVIQSNMDVSFAKTHILIARETQQSEHLLKEEWISTPFCLAIGLWRTCVLLFLRCYSGGQDETWSSGAT